ncbi:hypothetical protein D3C87_2118300 [compost metagenome]
MEVIRVCVTPVNGQLFHCLDHICDFKLTTLWPYYAADLVNRCLPPILAHHCAVFAKFVVGRI